MRKHAREIVMKARKAALSRCQQGNIPLQISGKSFFLSEKSFLATKNFHVPALGMKAIKLHEKYCDH